MIHDLGDCSLAILDDANIPVDIWLMELTEDDDNFNEMSEEGMKWVLRCSNYMPRRGSVSSNAYVIYSDNKEELQKIIKEKILPLYAIAVTKLKLMLEGKSTNLYYWNTDDIYCGIDSQSVN